MTIGNYVEISSLIASNITKAFIVNPCGSCNIDINTSLNAIHVHYMDYVIIECIYK